MQEKVIRINIRGVANIRLEELHAFQEDIKVLTDENYEKLKAEILADGFSFSPHVFAAEDGTWWILDGHQRRTCLTRMQEEGFQIPVIPCMEVEADSLEHARRLVLAGTSQFGTFQVKKLVEFTKKMDLQPAALLERFVLPTVKFDKLVNVAPHQRNLTSSEYTKKIQSPIYEPKGEKPELKDLADTSKREELLANIQMAQEDGLPEDLADFLRLAAQRHVVFNYEKIAEYYAHAPKAMQLLMEQSALVIIDFKKAIENGFVAMTKELGEAYDTSTDE